MSKRVNPRRIPATAADIERAKEQATDQAIRAAIYMMLYLLADKHGTSKEEICRLAREVNYLADSINRGYLNWYDIRKMLEEEYDVQIELT